MSLKVVFDTDIGSDIDDALALAYLLAEPECELLGITTVTGESRQRAMMASVLCRVAGTSVPIYPGAETPLLVEQRQPLAPQARQVTNWHHETSFPAGEAIGFLQHTIRQHPGEVILLATGPLTNVALLFRTDPQIPSLLRGLVAMSGAFLADRPSTPEWNVACDPHAAAIVYAAGVAVHRLVGLDVTEQVVVPRSEVDERFSAPLLAPVLDFASVWFERADKIVFHDPLTAATLFDDTICTFAAGVAWVALTGRGQLGLTEWRQNVAPPRNEVAVAVSPKRFFERFLRALPPSYAAGAQTHSARSTGGR